jgi:phage FluMu protein Com
MGNAVPARSIPITVHGSVVIRCEKCGMLTADSLSLNGATIKCPYCHSEYSYQIRLQAKTLAEHTT